MAALTYMQPLCKLQIILHFTPYLQPRRQAGLSSIRGPAPRTRPLSQPTTVINLSRNVVTPRKLRPKRRSRVRVMALRRPPVKKLGCVHSDAQMPVKKLRRRRSLQKEGRPVKEHLPKPHHLRPD